MADEPQKARGWGCAVGIAVAIALLPVLYALSVGPAAMVMHHGYLPENVYGAMYWPLFKFAESSDAAAHSLIWYLDFWVPLI